ncbi:MAG: alpha/beta fold hydrolase, partial [Patescibacteria group bacterium]
MNTLKWIIGIAVIVAVVAYVWVAVSMTKALTHAERHEQDETPANYDVPFKAVSFSPRGENFNLDGWYIAKPQNKATLIFIHGIGGTRSSLQRVHLAADLFRQGFNVLMFDLRAHGTSEGEIVSGGYFEQSDVLGAFDYVRQQGEAAQCTGLLGASMGAATTLLAATKEPAIAAVVADSSYADIDDLIVGEAARTSPLPRWSIPIFIPGMKFVAWLGYRINLSSLKPEDAIGRLSYPLLLIHGASDERIPVSQSERLLSHAPENSELWIVLNAEHANGFAHQSKEYTYKVAAYFNARFFELGCY